MTQQPPLYRGRFAPSPTGPLHLGSLLTAVASYVDAKANRGVWLVRMEDLDPPREVPGAADDILDTLHFYGLHWDQRVLYQSQRHAHYQQQLDALLEQHQAYFCVCSRSKILAQSATLRYPGSCRDCHSPPNQAHAVRLRVEDRELRFTDQIQGHQQQNLWQQNGDFVIKRKDNLFAYHLAVVVDDWQQGINHVVRGCDLLESTFCHLYLQQILNLPQPHYCHLPVIVNEQQQKLSKQTYAEAIPRNNPDQYLLSCLKLLGQQPPASLRNASVDSILKWAISHWRPQQIPHRAQLELCIPA